MVPSAVFMVGLCIPWTIERCAIAMGAVMIGRAELIIVLMRERGDAVVGDWDGVGGVDSSGKAVYAPPQRGTFGEKASIGFGGKELHEDAFQMWLSGFLDFSGWNRTHRPCFIGEEPNVKV